MPPILKNNTEASLPPQGNPEIKKSPGSPETRERNHPNYHKETWRVRLIFATPILFFLLVLLTGIIMIQYLGTNLPRVGVTPADTDKITKALFPLLMGGALLSAIAGFLLSYVVVKPLKQINDIIKKLSTGEWVTPPKIPAHEEIGVLQDNFNIMVHNLRTYVHERNKYIFESLGGGLLTLDNQGIVTTINTPAETILSLPENYAEGKSIWDIIPDVPENQQIREMFANTIEGRKIFSSEETTIMASERGLLPIGISINMMKDADNHLLGVVASFKDLSKIKQIQQQLHRSDRLAAIGTLSTGLAHEIRNPLSSMKGLAQMVAEDLPAEDKKKKYLSIIIKEIDRLNQVVEELLDFSHATEGGTQWAQVEGAIKDALFMAKQSAKFNPRINISDDISQHLPPLKIEEDKIMQAILNILLNAMDAVNEPANQTPTIFIKCYQSPSRVDYDVPHQGFIVIEIANNGPAISPALTEKIFDPFFTTKDTGSGLGLAISHQIIAAHSGWIEVSSPENGLTTFQIWLPILPNKEDTP
jgi:two-component system sensor histidine kinase AtoS